MKSEAKISREDILYIVWALFDFIFVTLGLILQYATQNEDIRHCGFIIWVIGVISMLISWLVQCIVSLVRNIKSTPKIEEQYSTKKCVKTPMEAYEKLDHTILLNFNRQNLEFNIDRDEHIDCNDLDEAIDCLEIIKDFIEKNGGK